MSTIGYINISLELFGGLLSLIFILCLSLGSPKKEDISGLINKASDPSYDRSDALFIALAVEGLLDW